MIEEVGIFDILNAPEFPALIEEYGREAALEGLPPPKAKVESYAAYAQTGMLHVFAATEAGALVGFIAILVPILPHYSCSVAVTESFFVASAHRAGGPGLRLLAAAEQRAAEVGSPVLQICAPMGGRLFELLPKCGYVETNRVFTKKLGALAVVSPAHAGVATNEGGKSYKPFPAVIPAMSGQEIAAVRALEDWTLATQEQVDLPYEHEFHAGIYSRTVALPAGRYLTGAEIDIATMLYIAGDVLCRIGGEKTRITGYARLRAEAGRKQLFTAIADTSITMAFATKAKTVAEAEAEFTREAHRLASRRDSARNTIIGERACLAESL